MKDENGIFRERLTFWFELSEKDSLRYISSKGWK